MDNQTPEQRSGMTIGDVFLTLYHMKEKSKTPEQRFEDYLEDEYQAAIKDSDKYFMKLKAKRNYEENKRREKRAENITTIGGLLAFPVSAALGYGFVQLLKLIIPGWGG